VTAHPPRNAAWTRRKAVARPYQPKRIRLLVVAEAPPADEERYFYFEGAATTDPLFEEVCAVLFEARPAGDKAPYLRELRRRGVFVIEAMPDLAGADRPLGPYVAPLLLNLDTLAPEKIILVTARVYDAVHPQAKKLPVVDVRIPFGASPDQPEFRQAFRRALVRAGLERLIRPVRVSRTDT